MCRGWFLACAVDCDRTKPSRHALPVSRMGKRDQPLYRRDRQVWIILVDFFERRTKLGVLNYGVRKNAGAANDRTARYFARHPLDQFAACPIDVAIHACHVSASCFQISGLNGEGGTSQLTLEP